MAEVFDFGLQQHKIKMDGKFFENNLFAVAGDTGRRLEVQLLDSNNMVQNTTGISLRLNAVVAGQATYAEATLVDAIKGLYKLDLPNGMLLAPGNWQFQWQITDSVGKKLHSFAFTGSVGSNLSEGGSEATNFYLNAEELRLKTIELQTSFDDLGTQFQNVIDETTGKDVISAPEIIAARSGEIDLNARLTKNEQETTAQFQQKANKTDVRENTFTKPINVSEMDTETKALFTGGAVAVVGEEAVGRENLKQKAVDYSKQEVISIDEKKNVKYKTSSDGTYKKEWINYIIPSWSSTLTERSTINPIKKNAEITVKTTGVHDRFTIFTSKYETFSDLDKNFKEIFIKGENGESTGDETYTFTNVDDDFIIVGITSASQKPKVVIEEFFNDKAFEEIKAIKKNVGIDSTPMRNIVENGDFSKGNESWEEVKGNLTIGTNEGIFLASAGDGSAFQNLVRKKGDVFYLRGDVKSQSSNTGISINGGLIEGLKHSGSDFYETLSARHTNLSPLAMFLLCLGISLKELGD